MNDGTSKKDGVEDHAWSHRKAVSRLTSSEHSMSNQRKKLIKTALEYDIIDIRSYRGYKGDLLIEFTTMHKDVVKAFQKIAEIMGFEVEVHINALLIYEIYCIFPSESIYELK